MTRDVGNGAIVELLQRRCSRRDMLVGSGALAIGTTLGCAGPGAGGPAFAPIAGSTADSVIVPDGFDVDVLLRWGDPIQADADGLRVAEISSGRLIEPGSAEAQATAFGCNCDGMAVFALDDDRLVVCVNHETPEMSRMFPGWMQAVRARRSAEFISERPESVALMRASVGVSVFELERHQGTWRIAANSALNRRITADTPMQFAGPAASHAWLGGSETEAGRCLGTLGNCAAGATPWGTYLTAEENTNDFFGNAAAAELDPLLARANERFGMRRRASNYRWEVVDERFDHARHPTESMKFGWVVELDPLNSDRPIRKRTALGRMRHEGATTVLNPAGRPVVYMGDDSPFEYFYKFVGDRAYSADDAAANDALLDDGRLYVARLDDDGSGEWLPLVYAERSELTEANGFRSQADVVLRCREAADLLGATPLDRPEDVAVHPHNGRVYLACTQGLQRGADEARGTDAANPRAPNPYGHILEFTEAGDDAASEAFTWEVFILAGDPRQNLVAEPVAGQLAAADAYYAGQANAVGLSPFSCPDNLSFDSAGNLWIVTDGAQPNRSNNGCFVCPTEGPERGAVRQFMSGPVGAEISGCVFSPDGETLFLTVQHPGSSSPIEAPTSRWPDGGESQPRSSLIAIRSVDATRQLFVPPER